MLRQNISIYTPHNFVGSSFNFRIDSRFVPDEIIVKNLYMELAVGADEIYKLESNIFPDDRILGFMGNGITMQQHPVVFGCGRPLSGIYTFEISNLDNVKANNEMDICFQLELIKH